MSDSRVLVLAVVIFLTVAGASLGFAAAAVPADDTVETDAVDRAGDPPGVESQSEVDVSDLERFRTDGPADTPATGDGTDATAEQDSYDVAVVGNTAQPDSNYGVDYMQSVLTESLNDTTYGSIDAIHPNPGADHPQNGGLLDLMDQYDTFVLNAVGSDNETQRMSKFLDNLTASQTVVYLDQFNNANGIEELSAVRGDPASASDDFTQDPAADTIELEVTADHPIFEGLGGAGDSIPVRTIPSSTDLAVYFSFSGYSGEVLADIASDTGDSFGPGAAVNEAAGEVLLSIGQGDQISDWAPDGTHTASAEQLLVNAVEYVTTELPGGEPPAEFNVTGVSVPETVTTDELISVTAEIENVGGQTAERESLTGIEGPTVDGGETVVSFPPIPLELGPGENTTIQEEFGTIEDINAEVDSVEWGPGDNLTAIQQVGENLSSADPVVEDEVTAAFSVVEPQIEGPFFEVSDLQAPTQADPGATIDVNATVTNIGNESDTQDIEFVFNGSVAATAANVSLAPDENRTLTFGDIQLPDQEGEYEHGVFSADDNRTATIQVADLPNFELTMLSQPENRTMTENITGAVEVTNVGDTTEQADIVYVTDIDGNFVFDPDDIGTIELAPGASTIVNRSLPSFEAINAAVNTEYEPGDDVRTGFQVGENLNPNQQPDPDVVDELAADISIVAPFFELAGLDAPSEATAGTSINVSGTITNTGGAAGTQEVAFVFDNETVANQTISLNASESTTVEFTGIQVPEEAGTFEHGIVTEDDSQTASLSVLAPFFEVEDLTAPAEVGVGTSINVSGTITNTGGAAGTQEVAFVFDNETVANQTISLNASESTTVEFTGIQVPEEAGTFEHGIVTEDDSQTAEITVLGPPEVSMTNLSIADSGPDVTVLEGAYDVSVEIAHTDGGPGDVEVNVSIGDTTTKKTVSLAVGSTLTVTFENATGILTPGNYDVTVSALDAEVSGNLTVSVDANGNNEPATDTTGDGLLNDVNGDRTFDILDVQALFGALDEGAVQDNAELFDFNDDDPPVLDIFDVQELFDQMSEQE
jgi:hypothetical protein